MISIQRSESRPDNGFEIFDVFVEMFVIKLVENSELTFHIQIIHKLKK